METLFPAAFWRELCRLRATVHLCSRLIGVTKMNIIYCSHIRVLKLGRVGVHPQHYVRVAKAIRVPVAHISIWAIIFGWWIFGKY